MSMGALLRLQLYFILINRKALAGILRAAIHFKWASSEAKRTDQWHIERKMWRKHKKEMEFRAATAANSVKWFVTSLKERIKEFRKTDNYQWKVYKIVPEILSVQGECRKHWKRLLHPESSKALTRRRDCTKGGTRTFNKEQELEQHKLLSSDPDEPTHKRINN